MARKFLGAWEPEFNGKHIKDMTDEEVDAFAAWLTEQIMAEATEEEN